MDQLVKFEELQGSMKEVLELIINPQQRVCHLEDWVKRLTEERKDR